MYHFLFSPLNRTKGVKRRTRKKILNNQDQSDNKKKNTIQFDHVNEKRNQNIHTSIHYCVIPRNDTQKQARLIPTPRFCTTAPRETWHWQGSVGSILCN